MSNQRNLHQCAALCWREIGSEVEILLITSRDTGRWVIPKGWPMDGKTFAEAAAQEAWEEAGVRGVVHPIPLGRYSYWKPQLHKHLDVSVFALNVKEVAGSFPERGQRKRIWRPPSNAAAKIAENALAAMIANFV
ncbi:NUDIX hydrolase [Falsirhodobacter xinxiangensis]|uniref:NUDIX hydrolase n=1 Tax=Falsirhodobacter xinxiangensis TaxID=2530049 RepID=UPI0010A9D07B|nr:NUDIX hydrolase [Rhodobacter xinxiangensis]